MIQCPNCTTWLICRTTKRNGVLAIRYWRCPLCAHREREVVASETVRRRRPRLQPFLTGLPVNSPIPNPALIENRVMSKHNQTVESPMTDERRAAVEDFDAWDSTAQAGVQSLELELAAAVKRLQACEYVVCSQDVARLHSELETARRVREGQLPRKAKQLRETCPSEVLGLFDMLNAMRSNVSAGYDPWDLQGQSTIVYSQLSPKFGDVLAWATQKAMQLMSDPHPESGIAEIKARLAKEKRWTPPPKPVVHEDVVDQNQLPTSVQRSRAMARAIAGVN